MQEQIELLRRQRDDEVVARRKAEAEAERDRLILEPKIRELQSSGDESNQPPEPQIPIRAKILSVIHDTH
jgi:hypothetical protein